MMTDYTFLLTVMVKVCSFLLTIMMKDCIFLNIQPSLTVIAKGQISKALISEEA